MGQNPGQGCIFRPPWLGRIGFKLYASPPDSLDGLLPAQRRELLVELFANLARLKRTNAELREEIARLKGLKGQPDIMPSSMDNATDPGKFGREEKRGRRGKVRPRVQH